MVVCEMCEEQEATTTRRKGNRGNKQLHVCQDCADTLSALFGKRKGHLGW